jgi:hypothetical protein
MMILKGDFQPMRFGMESRFIGLAQPGSAKARSGGAPLISPVSFSIAALS